MMENVKSTSASNLNSFIGLECIIANRKLNAGGALQGQGYG